MRCENYYMTKILNNMWWRVLVVHLGMVALWCGGLSGLGIIVVLTVVSAIVAWTIGRSSRPSKFTLPIKSKEPNKRKSSSPVVFRG